MDYKKIGEFIQNRRKELGLTQKQLGEKLNVTDKAVSKWENGLGCPDVSILGELSDVLGVGIGEILNGEYNDELKDNSEFIKNAVDYSKKVTEDSIYSKIRKVLYLILICIVSYISVMGIKQFAYLSGGVKFNNYFIYEEYIELKQNIDIIKEKGYLIDTKINYDFADPLYTIINKLEVANLSNDGTFEIKNIQIRNLSFLINDIDNMSMNILHRLKEIDSKNKKYYDLYYINQTRPFEPSYTIDKDGNLEGSKIFDIDSSTYYSAQIYYYNHLDSMTLLNNYNYEIGIRLLQLNKILELIIEVGEENEI